MNWYAQIKLLTSRSCLRNVLETGRVWNKYIFAFSKNKTFALQKNHSYLKKEIILCCSSITFCRYISEWFYLCSWTFSLTIMYFIYIILTINLLYVYGCRQKHYRSHILMIYQYILYYIAAVLYLPLYVGTLHIMYYLHKNCLHILYFTYRILCQSVRERSLFIFLVVSFSHVWLSSDIYIAFQNTHTQRQIRICNLHPPRYCLPQENNINTKGCQISMQPNSMLFYNKKRLQFT